LLEVVLEDELRHLDLAAGLLEARGARGRVNCAQPGQLVAVAVLEAAVRCR